MARTCCNAEQSRNYNVMVSTLVVRFVANNTYIWGILLLVLVLILNFVVLYIVSIRPKQYHQRVRGVDGRRVRGE
jgi:hypothetical protein